MSGRVNRHRRFLLLCFLPWAAAGCSGPNDAVPDGDAGDASPATDAHLASDSPIPSDALSPVDADSTLGWGSETNIQSIFETYCYASGYHMHAMVDMLERSSQRLHHQRRGLVGCHAAQRFPSRRR